MPTMEQLVEAIKNGENNEAVDLALQLLAAGVSEAQLINEGLTKALEALDLKCTTDEFNLVDILLAGRAMTDVLDQAIRPRLLTGQSLPAPTQGAAIILGTIEGDIHDLGKQIVATIMNAAGFRVVDLGIDVTPEQFINAAKEEQAFFIGVSSLLTITFQEIRKVKALAIAEGLSEVKVIAGGAAVNRASSEYLNVDYIAKNDLAGLRYIKSIIEGSGNHGDS